MPSGYQVTPLGEKLQRRVDGAVLEIGIFELLVIAKYSNSRPNLINLVFNGTSAQKAIWCQKMIFI
jgi:hypothetical protein